MQTVTISGNRNPKGAKENISFCVDVLKGLSSKEKSISSKYLYDEAGSDIFQEITKLREYYLTKAEENILSKRASEIVGYIQSSEVDVVELGVGDGHKTKLVLNELANQGKKTNFFGIDISAEALSQMKENIKENGGLEVCAVIGEYLPGLAYARAKSERQMLVLFLGSNIGNFFPDYRSEFLGSVRANLRPGDLVLTGFDLKKNISRLMSAYNDEKGVTAKFNLNLLSRINNELGGEFDLSKFIHHAIYNPVLGAMESHLISTCEQEVYIEEFDKTFHFDSYEPIHLEYSFKFSRREIEAMASKAGFAPIDHFTDESGDYVDSLWEAKPHSFKLH